MAPWFRSSVVLKRLLILKYVARFGARFRLLVRLSLLCSYTLCFDIKISLADSVFKLISTRKDSQSTVKSKLPELLIFSYL